MVDRNEAGALLNDVAGIEKRTREFLLYARVGDYLILWGALLAIGYIADDFVPGPLLNVTWWLLDAIGLIGTIPISLRARYGHPGGAILWRVALTVLVIIAFGTLWTDLAHFGGRENVAFWPTLLGLLLFVFGLWVGRVLAIAGVVLCALPMAGYFWTGNWFHVWMAAAVGGGMILGGVWLRR